jgi:hypothetical protein
LNVCALQMLAVRMKVKKYAIRIMNVNIGNPIQKRTLRSRYFHR